MKAEEIEDAAIQGIRGAQREASADEYLALQRQRELPKKSKLLGLQPWLDEEGQMIFGQVGGQFAPESVDETTFNPKKRWRRVQELVRHFWHRWIREWLPALNVRRKWLTAERNIQVDDVVLVM